MKSGKDIPRNDAECEDSYSLMQIFLEAETIYSENEDSDQNERKQA